jgi:hypothetical protein
VAYFLKRYLKADATKKDSLLDYKWVVIVLLIGIVNSKTRKEKCFFSWGTKLNKIAKSL